MGREVREGSTVDREAVKDMYRQREALTEEMEAVMSYLNADGMPGLNGSLVDSEGFPRADIDLYAVRRQRQRLRCLMNDLTQLTQRIAAALQQVRTELSSSLHRMAGRKQEFPQFANFFHPSDQFCPLPCPRYSHLSQEAAPARDA
mmetsp:Transcript_11091/g.34013  ORF Transcript_11091/g.34013 Transcript_11091/m.34013 type:complete len:146 (-) Transcript_11091:778-1215(-)